MNEGESISIAQALVEAAQSLRLAGVPEAGREAASLLAHIISRDHAYLIAHAEELLADSDAGRFREFVERRAAGEPLQYITGRQEFYGLDFEVTPDVLIPRPETELLVEEALELLKGTDAPLVCDVGTGSGCIAVTLLHERKDAGGVALDVSKAALAVAARNAARHGVGERLRLLVSDCFDALRKEGGERFDLIASNPPYVAEGEMETLQREVRDYEPRGALTPGGDGLSIVRRLISEAPQFLKPGGHLLIEIGYGQHERVRPLIDPRTWDLLGIREDLQGIPRTVALRLAPYNYEQRRGRAPTSYVGSQAKSRPDTD